jgi:hypothetical protein
LLLVSLLWPPISVVAQTVTPPPTAPPPAAPATEPATQEPEAEAPPPKQLRVGEGEGLFQPAALLQAWFQFDAADDTTTTFRIRRAELRIKGEIIPKLIAYDVMIDPARALEMKDTTVTVQNQDPPPSDESQPEQVMIKQPAAPGPNPPPPSSAVVTIFQDYFITFKSEYVDASIGQFKIPVSWEGYNSSSKLLYAERAPSSRYFGDRRDLGLRLAKTFTYFGYSAGLFNGAGQNNLDNNNAKDAAIRLEAYPVEGLTIAGVAYGSIGSRDGGTAMNRFEGDLRFDHAPFLFQGEYINGRNVSTSGAETDAQGFYAAVGWTFWEVLQPVVRFGLLDPNSDSDQDPSTGALDELWHLDLGVNYYISKQEAKVLLDYSHFGYDDATPDNEVLFAAQLSF